MRLTIMKVITFIVVAVALVGCTTMKDLDVNAITAELKKTNTSDQNKVLEIIQPYVDKLKLEEVTISFNEVDKTTTECIVAKGKSITSFSYRHDLIKENSMHYSGQLQELERQNHNRSIMENKMYDILVKEMGEYEVIKLSINTEARIMDVRTVIETCTIKY